MGRSEKRKIGVVEGGFLTEKFEFVFHRMHGGMGGFRSVVEGRYAWGRIYGGLVIC